MNITPLLTALAATSAVSCARDSKPTTVQTSSAQQTSQPRSSPEVHQRGELTAFIDPGAPTREPVRDALAILTATKGGQRVGTVRFTAAGHAGLDVFATIDGLPAGEHAYHVHMYGDCSSPDAKSAGPHFHFTGSSLDTHVKMITGNLGELMIDDEGRASHRARLPDARLHGPFSLVGRSVVVHARGNNPAVTPDGGAGDRIACGVIGVANPSPTGDQPTAAHH